MSELPPIQAGTLVVREKTLVNLGSPMEPVDELAAVTRERDALAVALQRLIDAKAEKDVNGETEKYRSLKSGAWETARETLTRLASGDLRKPLS